MNRLRNEIQQLQCLFKCRLKRKTKCVCGILSIANVKTVIHFIKKIDALIKAYEL